MPVVSTSCLRRYRGQIVDRSSSSTGTKNNRTSYTPSNFGGGRHLRPELRSPSARTQILSDDDWPRLSARTEKYRHREKIKSVSNFPFPMINFLSLPRPRNMLDRWWVCGRGRGPRDATTSGPTAPRHRPPDVTPPRPCELPAPRRSGYICHGCASPFVPGRPPVYHQ
jgi:hypothetical protein